MPADLLNYPLPLWSYLLLWAGLMVIIIGFACALAFAINDKAEADKLLKETWNELEAKQNNALEVGPTEIAELNHDYATLGMMIEDHHQQFADIQKELFNMDERLSRLEQRSTHIHIGISKLFQVCDDDDDDYTGPDDDDDSDVATLPTPLSGWVESIEGLDTL